jgi:hypothetical protein
MTEQLSLTAPIEAQPLTNFMARCFVYEVRQRVAITVHFWLGQQPFEYVVKPPYTGLVFSDNGWKLTTACGWSGARWRDVYMVETTDARYIDVSRIYRLPSRLAHELLSELVEGREHFEVLDTIRRALASRPWGFGGAFSSAWNWESPGRSADTEARLRELDACDRAPGMPAAPLAAGDRVIAAVSGEWASRGSWLVVECACDLCALGRHVAVDQRFGDGWRHISRAALRRPEDQSTLGAERWINAIAFAGSFERGLRQAEVRSEGLAALANAFVSELAALDAGGR